MKIEIKTALPNPPTAELKGLISRGVKAVEVDANDHLILTLTDDSTHDLGYVRGTGVESAEQTTESEADGGDNVFTITLTDGTTAEFIVKNGSKGSQGIQGIQGPQGNALIITSQSVTYQTGESGTTAPDGAWSESIPEAAQGVYLWTRTVLGFNDGTSVTAYSVSRMGLDGSGSVVTVNNKSPNESGNVSLSAADVDAAASSHGHDISGVNGLSDALSGKAGVSHAAAHATNGGDPIAPLDIGAAEMTLLWQNASPTSTFAAQSVYATVSDYSLVLILYQYKTAAVRTCAPLFLDPATMTYGYMAYSTSTRLASVHSNRVSFLDAATDGTTDNTAMIPLQIYGIKGVQ